MIDAMNSASSKSNGTGTKFGYPNMSSSSLNSTHQQNCSLFFFKQTIIQVNIDKIKNKLVSQCRPKNQIGHRTEYWKKKYRIELKVSSFHIFL